ncbi:MAG: DUF401 family protein [Chloroflexota bacterium]
MISPSLALLASIFVILILLRLKLHPGYAIFIGGCILAPTILPLRSIPSLIWDSLIDQATIRLLIVIACALTLSSLMEIKGLLVRLAKAMESIGPKLAIHVIPAAIGLVPMPGGALVSATTVRDILKRLSLSPRQSTFINFWFRHIWEFSIPVYPAVIITSAALSVPLLSVVKATFPMTAAAVALGIPVSYWMLRKSTPVKGKPSKYIAYELIKVCWPILLLVILILLKVEPMIAFPLTLVLLAVQQRVNWPELKKALKYGLNPKILLLLYAIMMYKAVIETSGAAGILINDMESIGLPPLLILVVLPFLMGWTAGLSNAFAGISFPLLVPYIGLGAGMNGSSLLLAYVSGMIGVLLSPLHLCFILSAEYFKTSLGSVYRYTIPLCMAMETIAVVIYLVG